MNSIQALDALVEKLGSQQAVAKKIGIAPKTSLKRQGKIASSQIETQVLELYQKEFSGTLSSSKETVKSSNVVPILAEKTKKTVKKASAAKKPVSKGPAKQAKVQVIPSIPVQEISQETKTENSDPGKKPISSHYQVTEGLVKGFTELQLFFRKFLAKDAKKTVIIVHGLGEHSGRYMNVVNYFAGKGVNFYLMDLRGHGKSEGQRGHILLFGEYLDDLRVFVEMVREEQHHTDIFLLGHSMGGNIVANYLIQRDSFFTGAILSAAGLQIAAKIPKVKEIAGKWMSRIFPQFSLPSGLNANDLSHDKQVVYAYSNDPMVHDQASARWFTQFVWAGRFAINNANFVTCPVLVMHGELDALTAPQGSKEFYERLSAKGKAFHMFEGFYHEIFNEVEKEKPLKAMNDWMEERIRARQSGQYLMVPYYSLK